MAGHSRPSLALIVNSPPYRKRVARADIDLALAAAALDFEIQVYFSGGSIMQLATDRKVDDAMLPAGCRAWAALPGLTETRVFAEPRWLEFCRGHGVELVMPVEAMSTSAMKQCWRTCQHVMVL